MYFKYAGDKMYDGDGEEYIVVLATTSSPPCEPSLAWDSPPIVMRN